MTLNSTIFQHEYTASLQYGGDCVLVGVSPSGHSYIEAYNDNGDMMQHIMQRGGTVQITWDEAATSTAMQDYPPDLIVPINPTDHPLNFTGLRQRGIRETDRISQWVQPLTIMEKMPLIAHFKREMSPMQLLGVSESYVLSQAQINDSTQLVCRRVRFAYALSTPTTDDNGIPYDYDSLTVYLAHPYDVEADESPSWVDCLAGLDGIAFNRPMDCIYHDHRLIIADSGDGEAVSRVHVFSVSVKHS